MKKMINNYIKCVELSNDSDSPKSGFEVIDDNNFKLLKVVLSSEEDITEGCIVKISKNSGLEDIVEGEKLIIIHRRDIIQYDDGE